jgi:hypothetical protein
MTCIVGIVENGKVYMGGDAAGVNGYSVRVRKDPKLFKVGEFLFGYTSSFRMGQLLGYSFVPPKHYPDVTKEEYMHVTFINHIREIFKTGGYTEVNAGYKESGGTFLVGYQGSLYMVDDDFQLGESIWGYDSVGCGGDIAMGSLFSTEGKPPMERLGIALSAASTFSAGVRGPFLFMETE